MKNKNRLIKIIVLAVIAITFMKVPVIKAQEEKLCDRHQISVKKCYICDPSLRERGRLWCKEHNRYEDRCFICHPEMKELDRPWCEKHHLYQDEDIFCPLSMRKETTETKENKIGEDELCDRHQISVEKCYICDPSLRERGRLWCKEHDRYEDRCFICHPELKEIDRPWCEKHHLYQDEDIFCPLNMRKEKKVNIAPKKGSTSSHRKKLQCKEHRVPEAECGICHPELAETLEPGQGLKIRFESSESASKAGVVTEVPSFGKSPAGLNVLSRVSYNHNSLVRITPLAAGVVQKVFVDIGDDVERGQVLVEIDSPEIAKAKSDYLSALANTELKELVYKREKGLVEKKISSQQEYEQALADYQMTSNTAMMTRQRLTNYGLTEKQIKELEKTGSSSSTLHVLAPFSGTLIERNAVIGNTAEPGDMLFSLVDLTSMWLELSVPEDSVHSLKIGDPVEATFNAFPEVIVRGQLTWLSSSIDEQSRMMKARAVVPNNDLLLKNGMFGQVKIVPKRNLEGLQVPASALQHYNGNPYIFVKLANDLYEIRRVVLGGKNNEVAEIMEGVLPHEEIVITRSFTVKSEFLKSRLGAGCVDD